jgi:ATP-dependent Clp protease adaptor protein ClpS
MTQVAVKESTGVTKLKTPNKYNVVMLNDEVTPMDFVIQVLIVIFKHTSEQAKEIMLEVHEKGRCVVGSYSYEVAEQKCTETITEAARAGYPLDVVIEESD